jgi:polyisoprenoid-binding protein YceI
MGMTDETGQQAPTRNLPSTSSRKDHWWRWILASVVVLVIAVVFLSVQSLAGPTIPALTLSQLNATAAGATSPSIDGTWTVGKGSSAGYRVPEAFLWQHATLVARTSAVTGTFVISRAEVSSAALSVDLTTVKANGKTPSGLAGILDTAAHPDAVFTLTKPIVLREHGINKTFAANATGSLAIHGTTRLVTFVVTARDSGSELEATGSIPILFSEWNIKAPFAIQKQGIAEFLLVMHHQGV